jgi:hypothetical protein
MADILNDKATLPSGNVAAQGQKASDYFMVMLRIK